jgi:2-dehydro-3-deoxygluconokinase
VPLFKESRTPPRYSKVVACLGETMAVLTPDPPGALETALTLSLHVGGAESNVAQYLSGRGVSTRWVSRVGDDPFGRLIRRRLAAAGVDVTGVQVDPERPTGVYFKHIGPSGPEVSYYRRGSAASAMAPTLLDDPAVRAADVLHLSGITPALSESCHDLVATALQAGPRRHSLVSFDINWRPSLWRDDRGTDPAELLLSLARQADIVFVGLDEAATLWGCAEPAAVRTLLPEPRLLVVKDSERAATAFHEAGSGPDQVAAVPALTVEVVDLVGAGDAFAAGVLAGLFSGRDLVGQLRLGHLTAAAALRVPADHGPLLDPAVTDRLLHCDEDAWSTAVIGRDSDARSADATPALADPAPAPASTVTSPAVTSPTVATPTAACGG